ncbi:MAG: hydroxymethylpyrimidine/phosphomethylpyrimidine kinase [Crocinitomicaceae bacterium]|nr:hydroxymethylpyrimidine/phosphomethylpyrimidine kinase [Crocinitomicaceae bacterium]
MGKSRAHVLSIAGFDPSAGAGVLADIKTFEQLKVYGEAVVTANTIQHEEGFDSVNWIDEKQVLDQLDFLLKKRSYEFVKIGLVKNAEQLNTLLDRLHQANPKVKVIWDPILSSSTGFEFHGNDLDVQWNKIFLVTPNLLENEKLRIPNSELRIYLKGGHSADELGLDKLIIGEKGFKFKPKRTDGTEKHGSGCVLSSAITANLALGYSLNKACLRAKDYVTSVLISNKSKLGYHKR